MTTVHAELCIWRDLWQRDFQARIMGQFTLMASTWSDRTPLHDAALQGRLLPLKRLLAKGVYPGVVTLDGITPLHEACLGGHFACAKLLLEYGADARAVTLDGATPLFNACYSGNSALLRLLLKHSSAHHQAHVLKSPIHEAAKRGHTACVELLLSHGLNADMDVDEEGTPLYCSCKARQTECVQRLLILGANVHLGNGLDTPLHTAVRVGGAKEVAMLLEHGANGKCRNKEGKTPLDLATDDSIKHLLQTAGPGSLLQLSRLCIRRTLGQRRLNRTRALYVPQILQDYILYQ